MRRQLVHWINAGLLIVVFIGFPAITGRNLGSLRLSDHGILYQLTVGGLAAGIVLNGILAWVAVRKRKDRWLCFGWSVLLGVFLFVVMGQAAGLLHFRWLKEWLLWGRRLG
jgi:predicted Abi (CAAX) family protease